MTKIQLHFELERPLDDVLMKAINKANAMYGIERISVAPALDAITVEYDATRLTPLQVDSVLRSLAIPVRQKSQLF